MKSVKYFVIMMILWKLFYNLFIETLIVY